MTEKLLSVVDLRQVADGAGHRNKDLVFDTPGLRAEFTQCQLKLKVLQINLFYLSSCPLCR